MREKPPLANGNPVRPNGKDIVSGRFPGIRHTGTAENGRKAVIIEDPVLMPMTADFELDADPFQFFRNIKIIQDRGILGIMVEEDTLFTTFERTEPFHALLGDQSGSHPHIRPAVAAKEPPPFFFKFEMLITEYLFEGIASAFRPLGIVVSGYDIVSDAEGVENRFDRSNLFIGTEVRDISAENDEIKGILPVDIGNTAAQIPDGVRSEGEMIVGNEGKTDRFFGIGYR